MTSARGAAATVTAPVAAPSPVRTSGKIIRVSSGLFDYICIWQSCESNYSAQTSPSERGSKLFIHPIGTCRRQLDSRPPNPVGHFAETTEYRIQKLESVYPPFPVAWRSWRWSYRPESEAFRCCTPHRSPFRARTCRWAGYTWTLTEFRELDIENI